MEAKRFHVRAPARKQPLQEFSSEYFLKDFIHLFRERGKEGERERNVDVREKHQSDCLFHNRTINQTGGDCLSPQLGIRPTPRHVS